MGQKLYEVVVVEGHHQQVWLVGVTFKVVYHLWLTSDYMSTFPTMQFANCPVLELVQHGSQLTRDFRDW